MNKKQYTILLLIIVPIGVGMFFAGRKFESRKATDLQLSENRNETAPQSTDQKNQAQSIKSKSTKSFSGQIVSKDNKNMMIKTRDGGSQSLILIENVVVDKVVSAEESELVLGQQITAIGETMEDGKLQTQEIHIRPLPSVK